MCGVAGFFDPYHKLGEPEVLLRHMIAGIGHRGPDGKGAWHDYEAGIHLGHTRLSILDLSDTGSQPMRSADSRWVISYNGEIYNHDEIRRTLISVGHTLRGTSDTEVLLEYISVVGLEAALARADGMFAFAVWDTQKRELWLARDRIGKKPLYFGSLKGVFAFGSDLRIFERAPNFSSVLSPNAVTRYLQLGYVPAPLSIYQDVWKLRPGHVLRVGADNIHSAEAASAPYWSLGALVGDCRRNPLQLSDQDAISVLDIALTTAVQARLVADVPVGAFLSGGIDSSLIVALMTKVSTKPVSTFSIGFRDRGYDEAPFAAAIAAHLGTRHTEFYVTESEALQVVADLPHIFDEPLGDSSLIPTYLVARLARQHVTVALSGDGGDELFAGYNRHAWLSRLWGTGRASRQSQRRVLAYCLSLLSAERWNQVLSGTMAILPDSIRIRAPGNKLHKLISALRAPDLATAYVSAVTHWPQFETLVPRLKGHVLANINIPTSREFESDPLAAMICADMLTYLPDDILTKVDRATMAVGLEARAPFLDTNVITLACRFENNMKIRNRVGKWLPRELLSRYVPAHLTDRAKAGFGMPVDAWLRGQLRDWAEDLLEETSLREDNLLNAAPIRRAWKDHIEHKANMHQPLWDILMLQMWRRARKSDAANSHIRFQ